MPKNIIAITRIQILKKTLKTHKFEAKPLGNNCSTAQQQFNFNWVPESLKAKHGIISLR